MGTFSVGKFAKIIGVNAQTLRYYEKIGIIEAKRNQKNGYRRYTDLDVRRVLYCRLYRSLGFSLDEIKEMFEHSDLSQVGQCLSEKTDELQRQINEMTSRKEQLAYYQNQLEMIGEGLERCWIQEDGQDFYRLAGTQKNALLEWKEKQDLTERLQSMVPWTHMTVRISQDSIEEGQGLAYDWGLGILKEYVEGTSLESELKRHGEYHRVSLRAVTIIKNVQEELTADCLTPLLGYIEGQGLRLSGDIIGVLLLPEFDQEMIHYIKLFAPVENINR